MSHAERHDVQSAALVDSDTLWSAPLSGVVEGALWISKLSFHNLTRRDKGARFAAAYDCWREVWFDAFVELENIDRLYSDDFTRQDEIAALFYEDTCIGLTGCRFVDLNTSMARDDSYFQSWPAAALDQLAAHGSNVCIGNNMTVRREWRGRLGGVSIKRVLMLLSIQRFLVSSADVLAGTMRNGRGMNGLVYDLGFSPIVCGAMHHGVEVDLVGYYRRGRVDDTSRAGAWGVEHRLAFDLFRL
jgi:hypothetical protein